MILRHWLNRHAMFPLIAALGILLFASAALMWNQVRSVFEIQQASLRQVSSLAALSLAQRNRALLEAALDATRWQLGSVSAAVCEGARVVASSGTLDAPCDPPQAQSEAGLLLRTFATPVSGFRGYQLVLVLPRLGADRTWIFGVLLSFLALAFSACALQWSRGRVTRDLLRPLEEGLISNRTMPIKELETIRRVLLDATRTKVKAAVAEALVKRDRQIAHDIRSPLAALGALLSVAPDLTEEQRSLSQSALGRIRGIARELSHSDLELSRIQERRAYPIMRGVLQILEEQRTKLSARGKSAPEITLVPPGPDAHGLFAYVDAIEFQRAISNLVDNAVDAIEESGKIEVHIESFENQVHVSVKDNGRGISESLVSQLGSRGVTFGKPEGTGLGLFHARELARSNGGDLKIHSVVGTGTTVTISLARCGDASDPAPISLPVHA